jgi:hypothetical protein
MSEALARREVEERAGGELCSPYFRTLIVFVVSESWEGFLGCGSWAWDGWRRGGAEINEGCAEERNDTPAIAIRDNINACHVKPHVRKIRPNGVGPPHLHFDTKRIAVSYPSTCLPWTRKGTANSSGNSNMKRYSMRVTLRC